LQSDPTARREDDRTGADSAVEGEAHGPTKLHDDATAPRADSATRHDDSAARHDDAATRHEDAAARHVDTAARQAAPAARRVDRDDSANDDFNIFRQPWLVVACLLLVASVVLLLLSRADAAFVCAALGVSAWFWNMRAGLKRKHDLVKASGRNWVQRGDEEDED
jgi:Flp pilus assembly protein TadB